MNCERVEELLSAYLDNVLAFEEWREVTAHLQTCAKCSAMLAEFSHNDALISHLPEFKNSTYFVCSSCSYYDPGYWHREFPWS